MLKSNGIKLFKILFFFVSVGSDLLFFLANVNSGPFGRVLKCHPAGNPGFPVCAKVLQKNVCIVKIKLYSAGLIM